MGALCYKMDENGLRKEIRRCTFFMQLDAYVKKIEINLQQ